jgi:peptidyl-tRNA hydrolase
MIKLYILVRTDMASMNAGRTAAQCAHAANYFVKSAKELIENIDNPNDSFIRNFNEWENQTNQGYGTTIIKNGGTKEDIIQKLNKIDHQYFTATIVDPEYPIQDGDFVHVLPNILTCAFAFPFGSEDTGLKDLKLYGKN